MIAQIDDLDIHYDDQGTGPTVLCVHGFPLSRALWQPLAEALRADHRVIAPDLRGFGQNAPSEEMSMARFADDLVTLLDQLELLEPVVMVGLSMGGYILFEVVRRYPERIRALVLADTRPQADDAAGRRNREQSAREVLAEGSQIVADDMAKKLFAPQTGETLRDQWYEIMTSTSPTSIAAALRAMGERPNSTDTLSKIDCPTLVVVGAEDRITPPSAARSMADGIRGARLVTVKAAGHMTPVEQPEVFNRAVREFLDEVTR